MEGTRPAGAADLPVLRAMVAAAISELTPTRGGRVWQALDMGGDEPGDLLENGLTDADSLIVIGTVDDVAVGFAAMTAIKADGGEVARVRALYVEPEARDVGVGEAMMDAMVAWANERRCWGVDAFVLPGNRDAKNFFERFGLTARLITVHRSLSGAPKGSNQ